jgi:subtilisin family serine protease
VGAVDQAGDQAAFTSFGKVDVYANGYEVESVLPGGQEQHWSGTSMASPQVVNLAAKLLAAHPRLTPIELKRLIVQGADEKPVGGQTIRLLNEKRSFAMAGGR